MSAQRCVLAVFELFLPTDAYMTWFRYLLPYQWHEPCELPKCNQRAAWFCPECGLLCTACDATEHLNPRRQTHNRFSWPPDTMTMGPSATNANLASHANIASHPADRAPRLIDPKTVTDYVEIAHGQFGVVFRALFEAYLVVVKVPKDTGTQSQLREYNMLAGLTRHPNLLALIGGILVNDQVHLVCPFMPGGSLSKKMQEDPDWGSKDPERTLAVAIGMFEGLAALHAQGIVHRDCTCFGVSLLCSRTHGRIDCDCLFSGPPQHFVGCPRPVFAL